ncbi:MAG: hypothetical protein JWP08_143 [Bryobacterales bacterium]|jgi:membrane protein YqaA with SNARE-associated domain|nr:hypothetical protein [Bryobacterales bacterium]
MLRDHLTYFFQHYGYWTVFFGILLESAGVPLPGETILIVASVLAREGHQLRMLDVAAVASIAAVAGDNLGFALGRYGGHSRRIVALTGHQPRTGVAGREYGIGLAVVLPNKLRRISRNPSAPPGCARLR